MSADLHLADCREVMRAMEPNSVDAIVSDPPYGLTTGLDPFAMVRSWLADEMNRECWGKLAALGWTESEARKFADDLHPREEHQHGGVGFMGSRWDSIVPGPSFWREALRVLKPGGKVLAFGATRTWHWLACALELSGFESRGSIAWIQGQGMQHGLDISKAMDADAGAERDTPKNEEWNSRPMSGRAVGRCDSCGRTNGGQPGNCQCDKTGTPVTEEAREWAGWGTQLAPKHEPIAMFRKPLEGTYVHNIREHGVGGLNIDGCRLQPQDMEAYAAKGASVAGIATPRATRAHGATGQPRTDSTNPGGRWPPNVALDEAAAAQLDAMVGKRTHRAGDRGSGSKMGYGGGDGASVNHMGYEGVSGPSAFFYCPKAPTGERDRGCEHLRWVRDTAAGWRLCKAGEEPDIVGNPHPTVKPLELLRWLVRLVTPPGGTVFDPFMGSGTTGVAAVREGCRFIGADLTPWAHRIARARIRWAEGLGPRDEDLPAGVTAQRSMFA